MLYNPNWKKPGVKTIEGMVAWLETQSPEVMYDFSNPHKCLAAQYLRSQGERDPDLSVEELLKLGWYEIAYNQPRTFGAALERARAVLSKGV